MEQTYTTRSVGQPNTADHRVYMETSGQAISAFHDVALYVDPSKTILNMVVTVPRWTNAKIQVCKEEQLNPIGQQVRKGKLRYVRNCFPHHGYIWNYGYFPQTWEDPTSFHPETKARGDNNPLDICEIGEQIGYTGQVKQVKVLGIMSLLDEDQTDWKVIVIDVKDPFAAKLNDVEDVERHLPGLLRATNEWFRVHEIPDGKPEKQFAFTGECKNRDYAMDIIRECHESWDKLVRTTEPPADVNTTNLTVPQAALRVAPNEITQIPAHQDIAPAVKSSSVDKWFFFSGGWQ